MVTLSKEAGRITGDRRAALDVRASGIPSLGPARATAPKMQEPRSLTRDARAGGSDLPRHRPTPERNPNSLAKPPPTPQELSVLHHQSLAVDRRSCSFGRPASTDNPASAPLHIPNTKDGQVPIYHQQHIHEQNAFRNTDPSARQQHPCPPAGNSVYPLDARITSTHPLYVKPPILEEAKRGGYLNFQGLVGDPALKNGTQNKLLENSRQVPAGPFSHPSTLGNEITTWEAVDLDWKRNQQRRGDRRDRQAQAEKNEKEKVLQIKAEAQDSEYRAEEEETGEEEVISRQPKRRRRGKRASIPSKKLAEEQAVKRVKNKRIERPFIIGSEAWPLDETNTRKPDTPPEHTKGWRVYVKVPPGQPEITTWLKKVQFKIFHTYTNPTRMVDEPPFQIEETGWGGFNVEVKLFFVQEVGARPQDRSHFLQLEPYGTEAEQEKQKRDKLVRSELLDYVEFNEPTETMFDILTSEDQFKGGKTGRGKGKAKLKREDGEEVSVALPEASTPANPYSKELEQQLLDILKKADGQVDELLQTEVKKSQTLEAQRKALQPAPAK